MKLETLKYVIKEKGFDRYMTDDDYFVPELEFAFLWLDEDDAYEYISKFFKNKNDYEVIVVRIIYKILDMSKIGEVK